MTYFKLTLNFSTDYSATILNAIILLSISYNSIVDYLILVVLIPVTAWPMSQILLLRQCGRNELIQKVLISAAIRCWWWHSLHIFSFFKCTLRILSFTSRAWIVWVRGCRNFTVAADCFPCRLVFRTRNGFIIFSNVTMRVSHLVFYSSSIFTLIPSESH